MTLITSYPFLTPLIVLLLAEMTKACIDAYRGHTWHLHLFHPGGFPSTHSAFVTSLLIVVAQTAGTQSPEFAIAFVSACVMWYDAMSSRRAIGEQAKVLNRLQNWEHFAERLGHTFVEVVGGIAFGTLITVGLMKAF